MPTLAPLLYLQALGKAHRYPLSCCSTFLSNTPLPTQTQQGRKSRALHLWLDTACWPLGFSEPQFPPQ